MQVARGRDLLTGPAQVRGKERGRAGDAGQLVVVEEDYPPGSYQAAEVEEVDEAPLEAVVPVDEGEVEGPGSIEEGGQRVLGVFGGELHNPPDPRLVEKLQAAVGKPRGLVGVYCHMMRGLARV